jgi:hypothetical protein
MVRGLWAPLARWIAPRTCRSHAARAKGTLARRSAQDRAASCALGRAARRRAHRRMLARQ